MVDFQLVPVEREGVELFDTQDGLIISMMQNTDNELPNFETELPNLYAQSLVLLGTIAQGDFAYDTSFGLKIDDVIASGRAGLEGGFAKNRMLTSLSALIKDLFENNEEVLMLATALESNAVIEPNTLKE